MDINSQEALVNHQEKIRSKIFLNRIYRDFYKYFKRAKTPRGKIIEIGSGGGFIKEIIPNAITSDVIKGPNIDKVFSATSIPFSKNSVSCFLMIDTFHHIKNPEKALTEMSRCLKPGGKIIMIEPFCSTLSSFIFKNIHSERNGFNMNAKWRISGKGRMSDANPAMPWIIFVRDRKLFEQRFPKFRITKIFSHTPFKYIISGGLSGYQLFPANSYNIVDAIEKKLSFLNNHIAMFMTIELEKI